MKAFVARETKYNFGRLIDTTRAPPVTTEKQGCPVVVVLDIEEYEKLTGEAVSPSRKEERRPDGETGKR